MDARVNGLWKRVGAGTTVGYKRILRIEPVEADRVRLRITKSRACPTLSTLGLYLSLE